MVAAGLLSLGGDWFSESFGIHSFDDLLLHGIVTYAGEAAGAVVFALGGVFMLWAFWRS